MKKEVKKLKLNRETLLNLDEKDLRNVAAGDSHANSCDPVSRRACTTTDLC